ncbi:MAG: hypothetical protein UR66_C0003G0147 [Candidatus Moranbacteria bacterium GW2011_GWE1_35_17]|nr:MAG: hypothetical protein UR66_C0003G0147 [Candidatus Moranbacteria bacterium GW2011_GWE1_35_17]KKP72522.1 MAG: hypothetical protein UR65_C0014G0035 [Candidatus Moranbacteria bacterium GW2011_GWE2_35_164]KKP84202.1 MAG: hypothetical protein UR83_C0025G0005 [Candidatus Moranbacteria bacterium GW2011_GWF2_35_54]
MSTTIEEGKKLGTTGICLWQLHLISKPKDQETDAAREYLNCPGIYLLKDCKPGSTANCEGCSRTQKN